MRRYPKHAWPEQPQLEQGVSKSQSR
jgi:hypothetical protein